MATPKANVDPGPSLYRRVRASFILQGTTFFAWCSEHQICRQWATRCVTGEIAGPQAQRLARKIAAAAGLT
jgi:hypothetical protein